MTLTQAILQAQKTTGKIRMKRWIKECFVYVENGFVRKVHNETETGEVEEFDIDMLLSKDWEVVKNQCQVCSFEGIQGAFERTK
jgi:hypothetical protein